MENKRKITQWLFTIIYNLNIKGIFTGTMYRGKAKGVCVPGLNCYSCPGALGSCPLGSLQNQFGNIKRSVNLYVFGLIALFGTLFGRLICGWACPFGLLQELIYKIPSKKIEKDFKKLRFLKYAILVIFVIAIPLIIMSAKGIGSPAFCKLICPQGTLSSIMILPFSKGLREKVGTTFLFKISILIVIFVVSVFIYRPFCRFICPLGAIYGLFNSIALVRINIDNNKCNGCNMCKKECPMKLDVRKECNSPECIRCGKCVLACNSQALKYRIK